MSTIYKVYKYVRYILSNMSIEYMSAIYYNKTIKERRFPMPTKAPGTATNQIERRVYYNTYPKW